MIDPQTPTAPVADEELAKAHAKNVYGFYENNHGVGANEKYYIAKDTCLWGIAKGRELERNRIENNPPLVIQPDGRIEKLDAAKDAQIAELERKLANAFQCVHVARGLLREDYFENWQEACSELTVALEALSMGSGEKGKGEENGN